MPLDVLIVTPSKPFGELIRLTLEADPAFHCTLIDKGEELRAAIQSSIFQTVIFDCSCALPSADEVFQMLREEYPALALFFIPTENQPELGNEHINQADGTISRPFDAALLPGTISKAVQKRNTQPAAIELSKTAILTHSWMNALREGILATSASSGVIIINGEVAAVTPEISPPLQELVVAAVLQYWNPSDTSDLMRYIKEPDVNQEWMMYATQIANSGVLALLFQPKTPVTKVRLQTIRIAHQLAASQAQALPILQPDEEMPEIQDPPVLEEILAEANEETHKRDSKNFPVEWFREMDQPPVFSNIQKEEPLPVSVIHHTQIESQNGKGEIIPSEQQLIPQPGDLKDDSGIPLGMPDFEIEQPEEEPFSKLQISETDTEELSAENLEFNGNLDESLINISESSLTNLDLGSFQPVDLLAETLGAVDLDLLQPVTLTADTSPMVLERNTSHQESEELEFANSSETFEADNLPSSDSVFTIMPLEESNQLPEEILPDTESAELGIVNEPEVPLSEKLDFIIDTPEGITDAADFENLPYFQPTTSVANPSGNATDELEADLLASRHIDFQPGGEPTMKNNTSEEEQIIDQPDSLSDKLIETQETESPSEVNERDLFTRMNQLQSAGENEDTETVTVALIPRQENFLLQRQIAVVLNQSMGRLSQAFGWKLDNLTIRPTYMQWTMIIPNIFSAEDMVSIVRLQTTQFLFDNIPDLHTLFDGDDIWAPENMQSTDIDFVPSIHWQNFIFRRKSTEIV